MKADPITFFNVLQFSGVVARMSQGRFTSERSFVRDDDKQSMTVLKSTVNLLKLGGKMIQKSVLQINFKLDSQHKD